MDSKKKLNALNNANNKINEIKNTFNNALTASVKEYLAALELLVPEIEVIVNFYDYNEHHIVVGPKEDEKVYFDFGFTVDDEKLKTEVIQATGSDGCGGYYGTDQEKDEKSYKRQELLLNSETQLINIDDDGNLNSQFHWWDKAFEELISEGSVDDYHLKRYLGTRSDNTLFGGSAYRNIAQEHPEKYREVLLNRRTIAMKITKLTTNAIEKIGRFMLNIADEKGNKPNNWLELFQKEISAS